MGAQGERVFLSEVQLIIAEPCAEMQQWHLDSVGGRSLSVFMPLVPVSAERGPQAVLPGTHCLNDGTLSLRERFRRCLVALCATHGAVTGVPREGDGSTAVPCWAAGDALLLDGRTMHRALSNEYLGAPTPILVLRYDLDASPPPGCNRWWLRSMSQTGSALDAI